MLNHPTTAGFTAQCPPRPPPGSILAVVALITLAVSLVALPACGGTSSRKAKANDKASAGRDGPSVDDTAELPPRALKVVRARTVVQDPPTGIQGEPQVLGYLEEKVNPEGDHFYFVFDDNYKRRLGYYTENGATYRYDYHGKESLIGNYVPEKSLLVLYGAGAGQIRLVRE